MSEKNEWRAFFDHHAPVYMENPWTRATLAEIDFVLAELQPPPGGRVLDVGCGTGRHAVELARRGYRVTGLDLSAGMLSQAVRAARAAAVALQLVQADAARFSFEASFDAAICLCEGAFGLLGMGDDPEIHDLDILRNVYWALKPGGGLLLTGPNGLAKIRQYSQEEVDLGRFDPYLVMENLSMECQTPQGVKLVPVRERGYLPREMAELFRRAGFEVLNIWGGTAGRWGRRPVELDEVEIMVVTRKPG